jgi:hypothetical protein
MSSTSKYRVLEPVTFVDGKKVVQTGPVEEIRLDDATAAELGDRVQKHGGQDDDKPAPAPQKAVPTPQPQKASGDK